MILSLQQLASALGGEVSGDQVLAPGPGHDPNDRSMCVKLGFDDYIVHSFSNDDWRECRDYIDKKIGAPKWGPKTKADPISKMRVGKSDAPTNYVYYEADGTPRLRVNRTQNRTPPFWQEYWNGSRFVKGGGDEPQVPYRLPELLAAEHKTVLIVEGEKDVDNVRALGFVATTNARGAGNWHPDLNQYFVGRDIFIIPDNDQAGEKHVRTVYESLKDIAREIQILRLPGLGDKQDVSDWIAAGGTQEHLVDLLRAAPRYEEATPGLEQPSKLIFSSSEFIAGFVPPDYLIDGLIQRRFCYSLTAPTGTGKTAVALLLSALIALGRSIGEYQVERGRVLYLAGENPDDVRMRWLAMADAMDFDIDTIEVHFLPGVYKLSEIGSRIRAEVEQIGPIDFLIVDTSAAYFEGEDENSNTQMGLHARRLRELVKLPGGPCVLVACHPVKNPSPDNILPRGGGAFLAEVDGNLTLSKSDSVVIMHHQGKFRGPDFAPIPFGLSTATTETLKDSKGRNIPTVIAKAMSERESSEAEAAGRRDEDHLLIAVADNDRASQATLARALGWVSRDGKPNKAKVNRSLKQKKWKFLKDDRDLALTDKGNKEVERLKLNRDLAGAMYG
jgi:AAA domain